MKKLVIIGSGTLVIGGLIFFYFMSEKKRKQQLATFTFDPDPNKTPGPNIYSGAGRNTIAVKSPTLYHKNIPQQANFMNFASPMCVATTWQDDLKGNYSGLCL